VAPSEPRNPPAADAAAEHAGGGGSLMDEIARVYAEALFEVAKDKGRLDEIREQLGQFAEALDGNREMQVFFFSPYLSSAEKREGIEKGITGADEEFVNFLTLLTEKHRMPLIFRIRRQFDELWKKENRRIDVTVTSAVELDKGLVKRLGKEIESQTGQRVDLNSRIDEEILGGIVLQVGNMVLDASIRNRLERLRKNVAQAA
jgi:F-type H+-transporting ATPase subunit delta